MKAAFRIGVFLLLLSVPLLYTTWHYSQQSKDFQTSLNTHQNSPPAQNKVIADNPPAASKPPEEQQTARPRGQAEVQRSTQKRPAVNTRETGDSNKSLTVQQPKQTKPVNPQPSGLTSDERKMISLVNNFRGENGLKALAASTALTRVARLKAKDMIGNNYFGHVSPTYDTPFDMMRQYGVSFGYAGENLAGAPTVDMAHTNLINSAGHRENILNSNYNKVGIGVVSGGPYGKMFVQMFTD